MGTYDIKKRIVKNLMQVRDGPVLVNTFKSVCITIDTIFINNSNATRSRHKITVSFYKRKGYIKNTRTDLTGTYQYLQCTYGNNNIPLRKRIMKT